MGGLILSARLWLAIGALVAVQVLLFGSVGLRSAQLIRDKHAALQQLNQGMPTALVGAHLSEQRKFVERSASARAA